MPGPAMLLLRAAATRLLMASLLLVGLVAMHSMAQPTTGSGASGEMSASMATSVAPDHADHASVTADATPVSLSTTSDSLVGSMPAPCHEPTGTAVECSGVAAQSAAAQAAVASSPRLLLLPTGAVPSWPSPRAATPAPPAPASTHVILRT